MGISVELLFPCKTTHDDAMALDEIDGTTELLKIVTFAYSFNREADMRFLTTLALATLLAACASTGVEEFRGPDGATVKSVKCVSNSGECMAKASSSCAGGTYRVIDSSSNAGGALADVMPGPFTWYHMQYSCGPTDGKMPTFAFRGSSYAPPPVVVTNPAPATRSRPTTTNCQRIGDQVNCTTY